MPIIMTCGFCDRGVTDPGLHGRKESCRRCNGKGEVVVLRAHDRYVGTRIANEEVWTYRKKGYKVAY